MKIEERIKELTALFEKKLESLFSEKIFPEPIGEAALYTLFNGGKRIRPLFTLVIAEMLEASLEAALSVACAIELIHTYSLIHDDLPCMDDDDFRRGKPTLHRAYSDGIAVLVGDFLLTYAFEMLSQSTSLTDAQKVKLIHFLAKQAGGEGMVGGQVMDLHANQIALSTLERIHRCKTGALFNFAIEAGSIISNAPESISLKLRQIGNQLGLAFQILDDLQDSTAEKRGSPLSSDKKNGKITYLTLLGIEGAHTKAVELLESSLNIVGTFSYPKETLYHLIEWIFQPLYFSNSGKK